MTRHPLRFLSRWLLLAGFALLIFGGKLWFISAAGSDLPTWDQWDSESEITLRPWLEGRLDASLIFLPHNEHRVITAKLYVLGLFAANRQWSMFVETTANAAVHTLSALLLLLLARRWLTGPWLIPFGGLLVLLFTLPFSYENTLFGFQVPFYLLLLFSLGQIVLTLSHDRFGWRWWGGLGCGVLAIATLASGFLASLAVLAVLGHRLMREHRWSAQQGVTAALMVALAVAGWLMKSDVPGHEELKAHSLGRFAHGFLELLAWPGSVAFPWALLLFVPAAGFVVRRLRSRSTSPDEAVLLGLLSWVLLQCLATAYARGGGLVLAPRYFDLLSLNVALGFIFLARLWSGRLHRVLAAAWLLAVLGCLGDQSLIIWHDQVLPNIYFQERQIFNVRAFLRTGDPSHLLGKPWGEVPYPDPAALVQRLSPVSIQSVMPPSVRRPVAIVDRATGMPRAVPEPLLATTSEIAASTWKLPGAFHWRSAVQSAGALPVLRFRVAGHLGGPGRALRLVVKSTAGEAEVTPDSAPGGQWKTVNVFRPAGAWWVEATDEDPHAWFAFTQPIEVGRLTWCAEKLLKHHFTVLLGGFGLLAAGAFLNMRRRDERVA